MIPADWAGERGDLAGHVRPPRRAVLALEVDPAIHQRALANDLLDFHSAASVVLTGPASVRMCDGKNTPAFKGGGGGAENLSSARRMKEIGCPQVTTVFKSRSIEGSQDGHVPPLCQVR